MPLPPWLRKLQQQWWFQFLILPALIAATPGFVRCAGDNFANLSLTCFTESGKQIVYTIGVYLIAAFSHSSGSASFNTDGTVNKQVQEIIAADKSHEPVAVVPVPSPEAREEIRTAVAENKPIQVAVKL